MRVLWRGELLRWIMKDRLQELTKELAEMARAADQSKESELHQGAIQSFDGLRDMLAKLGSQGADPNRIYLGPHAFITLSSEHAKSVRGGK